MASVRNAAPTFLRFVGHHHHVRDYKPYHIITGHTQPCLPAYMPHTYRPHSRLLVGHTCHILIAHHLLQCSLCYCQLRQLSYTCTCTFDTSHMTPAQNEPWHYTPSNSRSLLRVVHISALRFLHQTPVARAPADHLLPPATLAPGALVVLGPDVSATMMGTWPTAIGLLFVGCCFPSVGVECRGPLPK